MEAQAIRPKPATPWRFGSLAGTTPRTSTASDSSLSSGQVARHLCQRMSDSAGSARMPSPLDPLPPPCGRRRPKCR